MYIDNMYLARLDSVSRGSWQSEIWVEDPSFGTTPPIPSPTVLATATSTTLRGTGWTRNLPALVLRQQPE